MQFRLSSVPIYALTLGIAVTSGFIAWRSAACLERLWDEQVDQDIAVGLRAHPFTGERPTLDASQARLPMYVTALVFKLTGRDDLRVSRTVSLVVAALTILVTACLARMLFGPAVGILAALLLALSPYFLSFARIAMTEGDIFFSCSATLAVWSFVVYLQEQSPWRWLLAAVAIALALGSKFFAVLLLPAFGVLATAGAPVSLPAGARSTTCNSPGGNRIPSAAERAAIRRLARLLVVNVCLIGSTLVVVFLTRRTTRSPHASDLGAAGWLLATILAGYIIFLVQARKVLPATRLGRCGAMFALSIILCCAFMPVHMTEPDIAIELLRRTLRWDHRIPLALWSDHLRLYSGIILFKLTLPLGVLTAIALIYGAVREREDPRWRPCILGVIFYVVLLSFLPLRQAFYLMGVYPLILILLAAFLLHFYEWLGKLSFRGAWAISQLWAIVVVCLVLNLGYANYAAFPYFNIHGYDVVGDRWLGAESRGYRNLIQTPSDGVEELIHWCNTSPLVRPGARVVSFLWEDRIITALLPVDRPYNFTPRGLSQESDALPAAPSIDRADFVLLHINNLLGYGDRPPDTPPLDILNRDFQVVHTVCRGPLAVGWVYARDNTRNSATRSGVP